MGAWPNGDPRGPRRVDGFSPRRFLAPYGYSPRIQSLERTLGVGTGALENLVVAAGALGRRIESFAMATRVSPIIHEDAEELLADTDDVRARLEGTEILLAGAGGFLGSYLLDILAVWIARGNLRCSVTALDNFI